MFKALVTKILIILLTFNLIKLNKEHLEKKNSKTFNKILSIERKMKPLFFVVRVGEDGEEEVY